jgi:regulator of sirC expression with transglutaminase-like and TPR domain
LVDDFEVPLGLYLQAASPREIVTRMLRNLKEIYKSQDDWDRLIPVIDRLLILQPQVWGEYRDRGLAWAEQGHNDRALKDLQTYLDKAEDALDRDEINEQVARLRQAQGQGKAQ